MESGAVYSIWLQAALVTAVRTNRLSHCIVYLLDCLTQFSTIIRPLYVDRLVALVTFSSLSIFFAAIAFSLSVYIAVDCYYCYCNRVSHIFYIHLNCNSIL